MRYIFTTSIWSSCNVFFQLISRAPLVLDAQATKRRGRGNSSGPPSKRVGCVQCGAPRAGSSNYCSEHVGQQQCRVCRRRLQSGLFATDTQTCNACVRKTSVPRVAGVSTYINGIFVSQKFAATSSDVDLSLRDLRPAITEHLRDRLEATPVKFQLRVEVEMERFVDDGVATIKTSFCSTMATVLDTSEIPNVLDEARARIVFLLEDFVAMGSSWTVIAINFVEAKTATYDPIG
jgi:hypothetical protein